MTMKVAVTVGCPAVGKVEMAIVAYMQDCTPVIDWVAKPRRAGEVAPMKVRVVEQVHEKRYLIGAPSSFSGTCGEINRWGWRPLGASIMSHVCEEGF